MLDDDNRPAWIYEGNSGGATFVLPKFDELEIHREDFLRARIGDQWGWVTLEGELTQDKGEANYGSWYEWGK